MHVSGAMRLSNGPIQFPLAEHDIHVERDAKAIARAMCVSGTETDQIHAHGRLHGPTTDEQAPAPSRAENRQLAALVRGAALA